MANRPTREELKRRFTYDPETGQLTRIRDGKEMKSPTAAGYYRVCINSELYYAHHIIWCLCFGHWPVGIIDHKNHNCSDNRLANLREVSRRCNLINTSLRVDSTSRITGVTWSRKHNKYLSRICLYGRSIHIGGAETLLEAACLRYAAEQCLNWRECQFESSAGKYVLSHINA